MPEETDRKGVPYLTKARLEAITDGIFAFAMTLLVINLLLPDKTNLVQTNDYALHTLLSLYSSFFHYNNSLFVELPRSLCTCRTYSEAFIE